MAVAYASVQSTNFATSTTVAITKPVSLAVGDMMVAHIVYAKDRTLTPLTGWKNLAGTVDLATTLDEGGGGNSKASVQWKIADSGDVAASNFTWSIGSSDRVGGSIFRIIGPSVSNPVYAYSAVVTTDSSTPSFTGITPSVANSLLLMLVSGTGTSSSGYAIATSNPTWTERYDNAEAPTLRAGATAVRPEVTATGNGTWTIGGGSGTSDSTAFLIAVSGDADPTLTPTAIQVNVNVLTPSLTIPYTATPTAIQVNVNVLSPTLTSTDNPWSSTSKNTSVWTNTPKS